MSIVIVQHLIKNTSTKYGLLFYCFLDDAVYC